MTHEDYMTIADTIRSSRVGNQRGDRARLAHNTALDFVAANLAERFQAKDPDFDRAAFMGATVSSGG